MPDTENANTGKKAPPYAPFRTFLNALERLEHGIPNQLDRSVWPSYSGAIQGQLLAAFKFLGLIDENGVPTEILNCLVDPPELRKINMADVLKEAYPEIFELNIEKMSPKQLSDAIAAYGITGSTHSKALAFFLKAARYTELPLSPLLKKTRQLGVRKRRNGPTQSRKSQTQISSGGASHIGHGETKTVNLRSGGSLQLVLSVKLTEMGPEDRTFVFDLLDKIRAYEEKEAASE